MNNEEKLFASVEEISKLLKYLIAIELSKQGVKQVAISKQLKLATKTVNDMLKIIPAKEK